VLVHAYPKADIPVVQLSINESQPASFHFELGRKLAPLRDEGILIVGSGNLVHNLHTYDWVIKFELEARQMMLDGDFEPLVAYEKLGKAAMLSIPTPDHYLPLLYVIATRQPGEKITFPVEGVDGGSISMLSVRLGSEETT
jgi:4,5-DOPA dioxygenase extradiol